MSHEGQRGSRTVTGQHIDASVIIPTLGRPKLAAQLSQKLQSLCPQPLETLFVFQRRPEQIAFQDSNPAAKAVAVLAPEPSLTIARNFGAQRATGRYLVFLDDDCEPNSEDWLEALLLPLRDPRIGLVTGSVTGWTNASGSLPGLDRAFLLVPPFLQPVGTPEATKSAKCHTVCGGNFACTRKDFLAVGGFDTAFGKNSLYEDIEFSLRLRSFLHQDIWFSAEASVSHNQQDQGGVRTERTEKDDEWVLGQKKILLERVYGRGMSFRLRFLTYRCFRAMILLFRRTPTDPAQLGH